MFNKILPTTFFITSCVLAYYLFQSIYSAVTEREYIEQQEAQVIEKLKNIRKAQKSYLSTHGEYCSNWDSLVHFVEHGHLFITQRREQIITLDYGADSIRVEIDTLGAVSVQDSIFSQDIYTTFDPKQLPYISNEDTFLLFTDKISRGGVLVNVIEVMDPTPLNPKRDPHHTARSRRPLHFGSRNSVSLAGNWE